MGKIEIDATIKENAFSFSHFFSCYFFLFPFPCVLLAFDQREIIKSIRENEEEKEKEENWGKKFDT